MKKVVSCICLLIVIVFSLVYSFNRHNNKTVYVSNNNYLSPIIEGDNYLSINAFSVDNINKIIYDVPVGTLFTELLEAVDTNGEKAIYTALGDLLENEDKLYTTDVLKIKFDEETSYEYRIAVLGDALGEGKITQEGISIIAKYIINGEGLDDIALLAADYNHDGEVKMNDIMKILFDITSDNNDNNGDDNGNSGDDNGSDTGDDNGNNTGDDNGNSGDDGNEDDNPGLKFTANFIVQNQYISSISYEAINCETTKDSDSCDIIAPILSAEEGYEAVGFSENANATEAEFVGGSVVAIDSNKDYYSIVKKTIVADIEVIDNAAVSGNFPNHISCDAYNGEEECETLFPQVVLNDGYEAVGYSKNANATESQYGITDSIMISDGDKYYLITKKRVTVTFDKNVTSDNNIAADSLSFYEATCDSYNGAGCYIDDIPIIYSAGNEIRGFALAPESSTMIAVLEVKYYDNVTYYARVYNTISGSDYVMGYSLQIGNVVVEFETGMDANMVAGYIEYMNQLYSDMPELFDMKGKIRMFKKATYETAYGRIGSQYINTAGCTSSGYTGSMVDIKLKSETSVEEYRKGTIVHELSHAFDYYYGTRTRNYNNGNIRSHTDVINLYNSYLNQSPRPMRDYSYTNIAEFWADSSRWYYAEVFDGFDNAATLAGTPEYQPASDEIKNMVSKYLCIARNNYDEEAICP